MDIPQNLITLATNGSVAAIVFVMWYLSSKQFYAQQERAQRELQAHIERLFEVIEEDKNYKELLAGILSRLELKLDIYHTDKKPLS